MQQANHGTIFTGDRFTMFSVEGGYFAPSLDYYCIDSKYLHPTFSPTPTPESNLPTPIPTDTPIPANHIIWTGNITANPFFGVVLQVQSNRIECEPEEFSSATTLNIQQTSPFPAYSVNVKARVIEGDTVASVIEQPRPWNDFTARILLQQSIFRSTPRQVVDISWSDEVVPESTATPWPTWNAAALTPTPLTSEPRVLWIARTALFDPSESTQSTYKVNFKNIFETMGAINTHSLPGSQEITPELLHGYRAIIFGDIQDIDPLTVPEQTAVVNFVRSGGSILVLGSQINPYVLESCAIYASSIASPFGIQFSTSITDYYTSFSTHPILTGVSKLFGSNGSKLIVNSPGTVIGWDKPNGTPILAVAEDGYGRVVAYSDESLFYNESNAGMSFSSQLKLFARNVAAWLLHRDDLITATPTPTLPAQ